MGWGLDLGVLLIMELWNTVLFRSAKVSVDSASFPELDYPMTSHTLIVVHPFCTHFQPHVVDRGRMVCLPSQVWLGKGNYGTQLIADTNEHHLTNHSYAHSLIKTEFYRY